MSRAVSKEVEIQTPEGAKFSATITVLKDKYILHCPGTGLDCTHTTAIHSEPVGCGLVTPSEYRNKPLMCGNANNWQG